LTSTARIVVTGLIAQHPTLGGVSWDYVQYLLGLAALGHDVYYLEDSGEWPYNLDGGPTGNEWVAQDPTANVDHLATVMAGFGLEDRWMYRFATKRRWFGLSPKRRKEVLASADLLVNVSGALWHPHEYRAIPRLTYIDSDPAFTQLRLRIPRRQVSFKRRLETHDSFFTFGETLAGTPAVRDLAWQPTRQPISLAEWRPQARRDVFTTVMSWTSFKPLRHGDVVYAQKDVEMARFVHLPSLVGATRLEIALGPTLHVNWESDGGKSRRASGELLGSAGWRIADAGSVCAGLDGYRRYISTSKAEWSVSKNGYVVGRPGWFGCLSACYLAAGRPVVVQDTGFADVLPVGRGILTFSTPEEAAAGIREVNGAYAKHAAAAREIAEEYFDARKVLAALVERALA